MQDVDTKLTELGISETKRKKYIKEYAGEYLYHNINYVTSKYGKTPNNMAGMVVKAIEENYSNIEKDMNNRNSTSKRKESVVDNSKTRKKREELSISATKSIKKEDVEIVVKFN